ncbi:MAG: ribonuclease R [Oscillospiraceae bacterium]|nr:ribonuclease R [Oscillospiraceae bacterium]
MKKSLTEKVIKALFKAEKPLNTAEIAKAAGIKKVNELKPVLADLSRKGIITQTKNGGKSASGWKPAGAGFFKAEVMRVFRAHGFLKNIKTEEEFLVPGKKLLGSVPGDIAIARVTNRERGEGLGAVRSAAAEVILIVEKSDNILTGTIIEENKSFYVLPDGFISEPLIIRSWGGFKLRAGDKVGFALRERGERHSEHTADITEVYGAANYARVCVSAYLDEKNIPLEFSEEARTEAKNISEKGIKTSEIENRLDLREEIIFTIDGADTKDIDDAISVQKTKTGYKLGVHIADVSHYVRKNSALNKDAFERGTSVYIADMVIPMLPKELSNGICSLNPKEERLAFSCLMELNKEAEITAFKFTKTVIKSRLQGVYTEINAIFEDSADKNIKEKYKEVSKILPVMRELAEKLQKNRKERGAPMLGTSESKIICDENGVCVDIKERGTGISENVIEEFMLAANNCAAKFAMENEIPFVYRVHENPALEKIETLRETLGLIGTEFNLKGSGAADLSGIIEKARNTEKAGVINMLILRAMMKAKYADEPLGHFGLVMKEYAHFTSPIRRYPDLAIHRILSELIVGAEPVSARSKSAIKKKHGKFAQEAAIKSSHAELRAVNAERDCEKFFMAEYMRAHIGEEYDGIISGVTQNGFFVTLENTVEGRVSGESLSETGIVSLVSDNISLTEQISGRRFALGDKVRIKCADVNVPLGQINFVVI